MVYYFQNYQVFFEELINFAATVLCNVKTQMVAQYLPSFWFSFPEVETLSLIMSFSRSAMIFLGVPTSLCAILW